VTLVLVLLRGVSGRHQRVHGVHHRRTRRHISRVFRGPVLGRLDEEEAVGRLDVPKLETNSARKHQQNATFILEI